jgi:hypothetical protein
MNTIYEIAQESMGLTNGNGLNNQQSDIEVMSDFINTAISNRADEVSAITRVITKTTEKDLNTNLQYAGKQREFLVYIINISNGTLQRAILTVWSQKEN